MKKYLADSIRASTIVLSLVIMVITVIQSGVTIPSNFIALISNIVILHFFATGVFAHIIKNIFK